MNNRVLLDILSDLMFYVDVTSLEGLDMKEAVKRE